MKVLIKKNAYLTPFSMGHGSQFSGAAYDSTGDLINLSCRSNKNVAYKHINSDIVPSLKFKRITGSSLFLGHYHFHFGHFLLETASQLFFYKYFSGYIDQIIFIPFSRKTNQSKIDKNKNGFQQVILALG